MLDLISPERLFLVSLHKGRFIVVHLYSSFNASVCNL